jgi:hypothetical protein
MAWQDAASMIFSGVTPPRSNQSPDAYDKGIRGGRRARYASSPEMNYLRKAAALFCCAKVPYSNDSIHKSLVALALFYRSPV